MTPDRDFTDWPCAECNGTGLVSFKTWPGGIEVDNDDQPCPECADSLRGIPAPDPIAADEAEHGPCAMCETCSGNGMIGGPSYREPDEGGIPCPDCAPHWAANLPTLSPEEIADGDARQEHC